MVRLLSNWNMKLAYKDLIQWPYKRRVHVFLAHLQNKISSQKKHSSDKLKLIMIMSYYKKIFQKCPITTIHCDKNSINLSNNQKFLHIMYELMIFVIIKKKYQCNCNSKNQFRMKLQKNTQNAQKNQRAPLQSLKSSILRHNRHQLSRYNYIKK